MGYVERSQAWVTCNPLFVEKKNGTICTCIDYRPINIVIDAWEWPLPRIRDIRHCLRGSRWYTRLDLKDAFHRIRIPAAYRPLTAFHTHRGVFQFTRMPFGLNTAPATYQRFLDWVLRHCDGRINYVDDILVYAHTPRQLARRVARVLAALREHDVEINQSKSVYTTQELEFVGLRITRGNIGSALPVRPIDTPTTLKEWQSALGFANCFRDFIPNYAEIVADMYPGVRQVPMEARDARWRAIWASLHHAMTLSEFQDDQPSQLYLDASLYAVGAVLVQNGHVCGIFSKGLTDAQRKYSATDREHLALMLGVEAFRVFIQSTQKVTVNTDHTALLNRDESRMTTRQVRWKTRILAVTSNIIHVPGKDNPADYWSRWGWKSGGGDQSFLYKEPVPPSLS